ncbi:E4, partial [Human papillomavirus RTRX7]
KLIRKLCLLLSPAPHLPDLQDKQTQTPPPRPPPPPLTPRPDPVTNSHNKPQPRGKDSDDDHPVEQGDKKRSKGDQGRDTAPGLTPGRTPSPIPGPLPPPYPGPPGPRRSPRLGVGGQNPDHNPRSTSSRRQVEGHPPTPPPGVGDPDQSHPPPPPLPPPNGHNGEGETEGKEEVGAVGGAVGEQESDGVDHPPPPHPQNGLDQSLAGSVACLLTKWEDLFNLLVQNIEEDLGDYWKRLSTPQ